MPMRPLLHAAAAATVLIAAACGSASPSVPAESVGSVLRVVDGDTMVVRVDGRAERVRLLGIDTPEKPLDGAPPECGSARATASLARLARPGSRVRLVTDPDTGDVRDDYDRLLAFVSVGG